MSSSLSIRERGLLATAVLGGIVALGGVYVGTQAIEAEEKAYSIASETSADLKAAKSLAVELQRRLDKAERRQSPAAGAPGTLAAKGNNALNVKTLGGGQKWRGQIGVDHVGHAMFDTVENGIRAAAHTLTSYYATHGLDTLQGIVERFCESNKVEYIDFLSRHLGIAPDEKFNVLHRLPDLLRTMAAFENGGVWLPKRLFVGYDVAASAYQKGKAARPHATVVATVAQRPKEKPKPNVGQANADIKKSGKPAQQKASAPKNHHNDKTKQPHAVASR